MISHRLFKSDFEKKHQLFFNRDYPLGKDGCLSVREETNIQKKISEIRSLKNCLAKYSL